MKAVVFALLALVLFQAGSASAQGRLFCDELCGLTDQTIDVPSFSALTWVADEITTTEFSGTKPSGFQLETVGGIRVSAGDSVTLNSEADLTISTPISGVFEVFGDNTSITTGDSLTFTANDDVRVDANIISLSTGTNTTGDIVFDSNLSTSFEGVQGIDISSLFRDVNFKAPSGHATFSSDIITFVSGDTVDDQRLDLNGDNIEISTDGSFDVNAGTDMRITALENIVLQSRSRDLTLEAFNTLELDADHVNFESTSFFTATSLVGDLNIAAADTAGFYSHSNVFAASGDVNVDADTVDLFSTGDVRIGFPPLLNQAAPDITVSADSISYGQSGTGTIEFKGIGGTFSLTAADLSTTAESLYIATGEGAQNAINISSGDDLNFSSAEELRFDSSSTTVTAVGGISLTANDDVFLSAFTTGSNEIDFSADDDVTFTMTGDLTLHADDQIDVLSDNMDVTAGDDLRAQIVGFNDWSAETIAISAGSDVRVQSNFEMNLSAVGLALTAPLGTASVESVGYDASVQTSGLTVESTDGFLTSDNGGFDMQANDVDVDGNSVSLSAVGNDDQKMAFITGDLAFSTPTQATFVAAELEVAAPGADIVFGDNGNVVTTSFSQGDQYFTSEHDDIEFNNVDLSVSGTEGAFFRSDDILSIISNAGTVSIVTPLLTVSSNGDFEIDADDLNLRSDGVVSVKAEGHINFSGATLVLNGNGAGGTVNLNGGETLFSGNAITFDADELSFTSNGPSLVDAGAVALAADGALYFQASEDGGSIFYSAAGETVTAGGSGSFTSGPGQDITFSFTDMAATVNSRLTLAGNNLDIVAQDFSASAFGAFTHDTVTSTEFYTQGGVDITAGRDILIDGESVTFDFEDIQGDNSIVVTGDTSYTACQTLDIIVPEYTVSMSGAYTAAQDPTLCTPPGEFGDFEIAAHSQRTLSMLAQSGIDFLGRDSITVTTTGINQAGGIRLAGNRQVDPLEYTAVFNSSTSIEIDSINQDIELRRAQDDRLDAPQGFVNIDALDWIDFQANGHENNFNTQNFGIYIQTQENPLRDSVTWNDADPSVISDIRFRAFDGEMQVTAGDLLRLGTFQPLPSVPAGRFQNMNIRTTQDILLDAGNGALLVTAQGQTDQDELDTRDDASITFHAVENNISVNAPLAAIVFDGHAGLSFESLTSQVPFTAAHGISARTTGTDADLSYFSEFGTVTIDVQADDIAFHAGDDLQEADAGFTASREFILSSGQDQQYRSYGALNSEDQIGIHLVGEDGSITVTSAGDFEFYSAGSTRFDASTGVIDVNMVNDIFLFSNARANFTSQFTSTVTVDNGDIVVDANGGGGSVDIISDSNQSIVGTAGQNIAVTTANEAVYAAKTGISAITNTGDITVTQRGFNQDTLVHSEGSVLLQADGQTGIRMAGRNVYADAVQDINVDTAAFNVGSTGNTNTATEPLVVIRAGGDADTDGLNVDSVGNIDWDTSVASPVLFEANRLSATVGGDMSILANGPIHYNAFGHLDDGLLTLSAEGALDLDGEESVFIHGDTTAHLSTSGSIDFEAIGTDNEDKMLIHSSNNFFVSGRNGVGGTFQQTAEDLDAEFRDFDLIAGDILMQNTPGDGGKFRFDSDSVINGNAVGPVTFQATGEINVDTNGERSDIEFNIAGATTVSSSGSVKSSSGSFDLDSPEGVDITANNGEITATASDDITVIANSTFTASSRNTVTIEAGYSLDPTTTAQPRLNITSRGTAEFVSAQDFDIEVTGADSSLYVNADKDLVLQNSIPLRARDQGDVSFSSLGDIEVRTGGDFEMTADRDLIVGVDGTTQLFNSGDFAVTATAAGANVLIQSDGNDVLLSASTDSTITAGDSTTVSDLIIDIGDDVFWEQNFEEGSAGGIRVASTAPGAVTSINAEDDTVLAVAEVGILFESSEGFGLFSTGQFDATTTQQGGDIMLESRDSDVQITATTDFDFSSDDAIASPGAVVFIEGTGNGSDQAPSVTLAASVTGGNDFAEVVLSSERNLNIRSENRVVFDQSLGGGASSSDFSFVADSAVVLESNGIAPGNNPYGVLLEADEGVTFDVDNNLRIEATGPGGIVSLTGSETVSIDATSMEVLAGDTLNFYSGYTPPLNAALDERIAIEFVGGDLTFTSTHRNVVINAEDISWSTSAGDLRIRSNGPGAAVNFATADTDATIDADDISISSAGRLEMIAGNDLELDAGNALSLEALDSITIQADDDIFFDFASLITITADESILFHTEFGVVDTQPDGFGANQRFYIPELDLRAGVGDYQYNLYYLPYWDTVADTGYGYSSYGPFINTASYLDLYRHEEENETPGCENRSFGFDSLTHDMCFCQYGKWMCARNKSVDYLNMNFP